MMTIHQERKIRNKILLIRNVLNGNIKFVGRRVEEIVKTIDELGLPQELYEVFRKTNMRELTQEYLDYLESKLEKNAFLIQTV